MTYYTDKKIDTITNHVIATWKPEDYWWNDDAQNVPTHKTRNFAGLTLEQCGEIVDYLQPKQWRVHVTFRV